MKIQCPHCGYEHEVTLATGRPRLNISLKNVCDALQNRRSVAGAAKELNCSQGYIFNALKTNGMKVKDVIGRRLPLVRGEL